LVPLWKNLLQTLYKEISENYDVPANLQAKHLRVFMPVLPIVNFLDDPLETVQEYKELVYGVM